MFPVAPTCEYACGDPERPTSAPELEGDGFKRKKRQKEKSRPRRRGADAGTVYPGPTAPRRGPPGGRVQKIFRNAAGYRNSRGGEKFREEIGEYANCIPVVPPLCMVAETKGQH